MTSLAAQPAGRPPMPGVRQRGQIRQGFLHQKEEQILTHRNGHVAVYTGIDCY